MYTMLIFQALFIALYMAAVERKTEDTDDVITPTFDASNERVKVIKIESEFFSSKDMDTIFK